MTLKPDFIEFIFHRLHMELSQSPSREPESPHHRWAGLLGTVVAVSTITLPLLMIASYSPSRSNAEPLSQSIYSLTE